MHFSMRDWTIFSASSIFFFTHAIPLTWPWKIKRTRISRPQPAPRLTLLPKTRARIDVLGRDKNFRKWSHIFWGTGPTKTYWERKINHLKVFVLNIYPQTISSLSSFLTKLEIRLRYRKISTMMFLSIEKSLL